MIQTAILCSGQGAQNARMFELLEDAPEAAAIFESADRVFGQGVRALVRSGRDLHDNATAQLLCCTQALATWAVLEKRVPGPLLVAGYSVGELAAWGVAGVLDAAWVLELAKTRAACMDRATTEPSGLLAIRGMKLRDGRRLADAHGGFVAIINGPAELIIGGPDAALRGVQAEIDAVGSCKATRLRVSVAAHTPLLQQASEDFDLVLRARIPRVAIAAGMRLLSGIDGDPVFAIAGREKLARQISQTIDWAACIDSCRSAGVEKVIELGPGSALAGMMHTAMPQADCHSIAEFRSLAGFTAWACGS
jgi:[acyl-carrier-protein] S-malonyltransferase